MDGLTLLYHFFLDLICLLPVFDLLKDFSVLFFERYFLLVKRPHHQVVVSFDDLEFPVVILGLLQLDVEVQDVLLVLPRLRKSLHCFLLALGDAAHLAVLGFQQCQLSQFVRLVVL